MKTGTGLLVKDFTDNSYKETIAKIPVLLNADAAKIRRAALEEYSLDYGISVYYKVYERLTATPNPQS